jgi:hypothetical protein
VKQFKISDFYLFHLRSKLIKGFPSFCARIMKIPGLVLDEDDEDQRQPISLNSPSSENLCGM